MKAVKEKKCRFCGDKFTPQRGLQSVCSFICALKYTERLDAKKEKKARMIWKREAKEKLKTLTDFENEAKKVFQRWVRKRDEGLPCISCGCVKCADYSGGHYFDAGVYSGLIFHEDNCHLQCNSHCNGFLNGNKPNYRIGLVKRIGLERVVWLEENKDRLRNKKFTREQLIAIKNKYSELLRK